MGAVKKTEVESLELLSAINDTEPFTDIPNEPDKVKETVVEKPRLIRVTARRLNVRLAPHRGAKVSRVVGRGHVFVALKNNGAWTEVLPDEDEDPSVSLFVMSEFVEVTD